MSLNRKAFLQQSVFSSLALSVPWNFGADETPLAPAVKRKYKMQLNGGLIGVKADQSALIELASKYGFEAVVALPQYLHGLTTDHWTLLKDNMKTKNLSFGMGETNVEFRKSEEIFKKSLASLPAKCAVLQKAGVTRSMTWIMSNHSDLNYLQNFRLHTARLKEVAGILKDYDIRYGLEYVGPKSIWAANNFPFIHTMAELRELIAAIGQSNVGIHLDTAHWFTSGEDLSAILSLTNNDVVGCDLNDAIKGYDPIQNQPGYQRELPAATGVIDTRGFLNALKTIGYDGFVQAEPFNEELNKLDDEAAVQKTADAMKKAVAMVD
ncbi:MAG: TIM barrel protein [Chitinophagaceae bacterium]